MLLDLFKRKPQWEYLGKSESLPGIKNFPKWAEKRIGIPSMGTTRYTTGKTFRYKIYAKPPISMQHPTTYYHYKKKKRKKV